MSAFWLKRATSVNVHERGRELIQSSYSLDLFRRCFTLNAVCPGGLEEVLQLGEASDDIVTLPPAAVRLNY